MAASLGGNRKRDLEDPEDKPVTKKGKLIYLEIYDLPEELITVILAKVSKKNQETLSLVSKQWLQITRSRDFWKLSCYHKWPTTVDSDVKNSDYQNIAIPTLFVNEQTLVDWRFYYYLRASVCTLMVDLALVWFTQDKAEWIYTMLCDLERLIGMNAFAASSFRLFRGLYELCLKIQDKAPALLLYLLQLTIRVFHTIKYYDGRAIRLLGLLTEFMIHLGSLNLGQSERQDLIKFQYPLEKEIVLLDARLANTEFLDVVIDIATRVFHCSSDWKTKASAVSVAWVPDCTYPEYFNRYCNLAMNALSSSDPNIGFAGLVGLNKMVIQISVNWAAQPRFTDDQVTMMLTMFISAFNRFPDVMIDIFTALLALLEYVKPELLPDTLLRDYSVNMLRVLANADQVQQELRPILYGIKMVGATFKDRLSEEMGFAKVAFYEAAMTGALEIERLLASYIQFGIFVKGREFTFEFRQLVKQIADGTLPFKVSVLKCFEHFGAVWISLTESENEHEEIVQALLNAIPKEVCEYGQSPFYPWSIAALESGQEEFPETKAELYANHSYDLSQLNLSFSFYKRDARFVHFVPKEDFKQVTPSTRYRSNFDAQLPKLQTKEAFYPAIQLAQIVASNKGKYLKHAQTALNALLAMEFGLPDGGFVPWRESLIALLQLVQPNMDPKDLLHYVGIILDLILQWKIKAEPNLIVDLFSSCVEALMKLPRLTVDAITLTKLIDVFLVQSPHTLKPPKFTEFMQGICIEWPRAARQALECSNLPLTLRAHIHDTDPLESMVPYLTLCASLSALYGYDNVMVVLLRSIMDRDNFEDRIVRLCRELYIAATNGKITLSETDLLFLRNFLVLEAVNWRTGRIAIIPKSGPRSIERLREALAATEENKLDTGVPELNEHITGLDLAGVCKLLFLNQKDENDSNDESDLESGNDDSEI